MKNIKFMHITGKVGHIFSIAFFVFLVIFLIASVTLSGFLISLPDDTVKATPGLYLTADINLENTFGNLFGFVDEMDNEVHYIPDSENGDYYQAKDGKLTGTFKSKNHESIKYEIDSKGNIHGLATVEYSINNRQIGIVIIPHIISALFLLFASFYGRRLFKELKSAETPFTETISKNLLKLSVIILGYSFIPAVASNLLFSLMGLGTFDSSGQSIRIAFSLTTIVVAVVLFMLSLIFKYGTSLQKQADETL